MTATDRIRELWPRHCLTPAQCRDLATLIDRNEGEGGLLGRDREQFDHLLDLART